MASISLPTVRLGSIFDEALDRLEETFSDTTSKSAAITDHTLQIGLQAMYAISSLKGAYVNSLGQSYEQADASIKEGIDDIQTIGTIFKAEESTTLLKKCLTKKFIVKSSALSSSHIPLISSAFFQASAASATTTKITITVLGRFAYAKSWFCAPSFTLGGEKCRTIDETTTTEKLHFDVDVPSDTLKDRCSYLQGELSVPWKTGTFSLLPTTSTYKVLVSSQKLFYTELVDVKPSKTKEQRSVTFKGDPGFEIVDNSFIVGWPEGGPFGGSCDVTVKKVKRDEIECVYSEGEGYGKFQVYFNEKQARAETSAISAESATVQMKELASSAPISNAPKQEVDLKEDK